MGSKTNWHKNYNYCQRCKTTKGKYLAKGLCKKCYTRDIWARWTKRKMKRLFIICTKCNRKWKPKRPISKAYNPKTCPSCGHKISAFKKKWGHQVLVEKQFGKSLKAILKELYCNRKMTGLEIAERLNISHGQLYAWGNEFGIKFRNPAFKRGNKLFLGLTPHNKGRTLEQLYGKKRALSIKNLNREIMAKENRKRWRRGLYKYSRMGAGIAGTRKDTGFQRSTWEANLARIFLSQGKKFCYEPKVFQLKGHNGAKIVFTPDFKIHGSWWEVKGWLNKASVEKIRLFMKQHPQEKLILVGHSRQYLKCKRLLGNCNFLDYCELEEKFKSSIPNWETENINLKTCPELFK